ASSASPSSRPSSTAPASTAHPTPSSSDFAPHSGSPSPSQRSGFCSPPSSSRAPGRRRRQARPASPQHRRSSHSTQALPPDRDNDFDLKGGNVRDTPADNIDIITRFEQAFREGDQATIDALCDPGLVDHNPAPDHESTLAGFKQKVAGFKAIFPDLREDLQDIIANRDAVATRWVVTGSLQREFMGIPASGQPIRVEGMNFYRLKGG